MTNIFREKLNKLPVEVAFFLDSLKSVDYNVIITERYGIEDVKDVKNYLELINKIFFKELLMVGLFSQVKKLFRLDDKKAREMSCDIAGMRLFVIEDWLDKDIGKYIEDLGGDRDSYDKYIEEHTKAIPIENEYFKEQLGETDEDIESIFTDDEISHKEIVIKEVFSEKLMDVLTWNDENIIQEINAVLLYLLNNRGQVFKNTLVNLLLNNNRRVSDKKFLLEDKEVGGTVANWLRYFIEENGSNLFSVVTLSDFVNNADNCRTLNDEEKEKLSRVLGVYRNLNFFPDSMEESGWELIPLQVDDVEEQFSFKNGAKPVVSKENINIGKKEALVVTSTENIVPDPKLLELQNELKKYPEGSIQKMVIQEEIKKYQK